MAQAIIAADGTQGSEALPTNNVTRSELVSWLQEAKGREAGQSYLKPLEEVAAAGPVTVTATGYGTKALSTDKAVARAALENVATLTGTGAVDVAKSMTQLNAVSGAFVLTLPNGTFVGQEIAIVFVDEASTATWTASGLTNLLGFTGLVFSAAAHSGCFKWNTTSSKWIFTGGNAQLV